MNPREKARIGILLFIVAEIMFFAGLIASFWVIRYSLPDWPPPGQPRYPVGITFFNTLILLFSAVTLTLFQTKKKILYFHLTVLFGFLFLFLQGREWVRLIAFGLTLTSSLYGGIFYLIVGAHGIHVLFGLLFLLLSSGKLYTPTFLASSIFWFFVVFLWPILYLTVYILPGFL